MASVTLRLALATALACALAAPLRAAETAFDPAVARRISIDALQRRRAAGEKPIIVDSRATATDVTIRGAVHVPNDQLDAWAKKTPKQALIVTYCA